MAPGGSRCVPGNVRHEVYVIEDAKAIEIFSLRRGGSMPEIREPVRFRDLNIVASLPEEFLRNPGIQEKRE